MPNLKNYHNQASDESRRMCLELYELLSKSISNLERTESQQWCGLAQSGRSKFAYINHRKRMSRIEIWCMGDPADLQRHTRLKVQKRRPTTGGFGKRIQRVFLLTPLGTCQM